MPERRFCRSGGIQSEGLVLYARQIPAEMRREQADEQDGRHTCGCSGPIAALSIFINPWFLVGYVLLTPIIWSSIRLKRHTALQLLAGCVIPVLAMLICRAQFL